MRVRRRHWPVGQGLFTSGEIDVAPRSHPNSARLNYVYDCGARRYRDGSSLDAAVAAYTSKVDKIEALFISHLDEDHVVGLDQLLGTVTAETVYLPYVDEAAPILDVLDAAERGEASASLIQAQLDPGAWFGQRGVRRVIFVGRGDAPPDGGPTLPEPIRPPEGDLEPHFQESQEPDLVETRQVDGHECMVGRVELGFSVFASWGRAFVDWVLIPYVYPAPQEDRPSFMNELRRVLGVAPGGAVTAKIRSDALRAKASRHRIKKCYDQLFPDGATHMHNRLSMSLYSGPTGAGQGREWWLCRKHPWHRFSYDTAVGWLGTGDATLKVKKVRDDFRRFFRNVEQQVGSLVLPHHGSAESFHSSLLQMPALRYCIACSDDPNRGYRHPSPSVVAAVYKASKQLDHVSGRHGSALTEVVWDRPVRRRAF
jgi:hypothetical protein